MERVYEKKERKINLTRVKTPYELGQRTSENWGLLTLRPETVICYIPGPEGTSIGERGVLKGKRKPIR